MLDHLAVWHETCMLQFNQTKIDRLKVKSASEGDADTSSAVHTCTSHSAGHLADATLFFDEQAA
jgi:hypothetical protein